MTTLLPSIFTLVVDEKPTLVFQAQNMREAFELCNEQWLKSDLLKVKSKGRPVWAGKARLRARISNEDEALIYAAAKDHAPTSEDILLVWLMPIDGRSGNGLAH